MFDETGIHWLPLPLTKVTAGPSPPQTPDTCTGPPLTSHTSWAASNRNPVEGERNCKGSSATAYNVHAAPDTTSCETTVSGTDTTNTDGGSNGNTPSNGNPPTNGNTPSNGNPPTNGNTPSNGNPPTNGNTPSNGNPPTNGNTPSNGNPPTNGNTLATVVMVTIALVTVVKVTVEDPYKRCYTWTGERCENRWERRWRGSRESKRRNKVAKLLNHILHSN